MLLADPTLAIDATRDVVGIVAHVAGPLGDPMAPETSEHHTHKHGDAPIRPLQLLPGGQLALLHQQREPVQLHSGLFELAVHLTGAQDGLVVVVVGVIVVVVVVVVVAIVINSR